MGIFWTLNDNQCLSFPGVLLGKALKALFLRNDPYASTQKPEEPSS
jgi:hypothetical protein